MQNNILCDYLRLQPLKYKLVQCIDSNCNYYYVLKGYQDYL